ncbi:hypothetical protein BN946_scf184983.g40 [Trametes cinnabarina]|uniref:Condensin complex subunit 1 N-terminal domain-containing protein n=1 Tax=Pycnoporus cinnabarinus TaxID=5643 RepID=A0A060SDG3_PYCCI|nr:hypothetical protein BN946_scf184983.g40 [Trametes cinnabarina]
MDSFELQDELQALQDVDAYSFDNETDISALDPRSLNDLLDSAVDAFAHSSDNITDPPVFDAYRSLLKHATVLQGSHMTKILDSISSAYLAHLEAAVRDVDEEDQHTFMAHKMPLEMYAFLLNWFVSAAKKVKAAGDDDLPAQTTTTTTKSKHGRGGKAAASRSTARKPSEEWSWQDQIPHTLKLISHVLHLKSQRIWQTSAERENFINCVVRPVYHVMENEQFMKSADIRRAVYKAICLAVKHQGHILAAQISIMQSLQYYEHLAEPMAECLNVLARDFDHSQLGDDILREIASKSFSAQDSKGPRVFSRFIVRYAELAPHQVLKQLALLLAHLNSESYPMCNTVVELIGSIICKLADDGLNAAGPDDVDHAKQLKQINGLSRAPPGTRTHTAHHSRRTRAHAAHCSCPPPRPAPAPLTESTLAVRTLSTLVITFLRPRFLVMSLIGVIVCNLAALVPVICSVIPFIITFVHQEVVQFLH